VSSPGGNLVGRVGLEGAGLVVVPPMGDEVGRPCWARGGAPAPEIGRSVLFWWLCVPGLRTFWFAMFLMPMASPAAKPRRSHSGGGPRRGMALPSGIWVYAGSGLPDDAPWPGAFVPSPARPRGRRCFRMKRLTRCEAEGFEIGSGCGKRRTGRADGF